MRRFWLLLLMFVLPLQMSWAAVHVCDDQAQATHQHEARQAVADSQQHRNLVADIGDLLADDCCAAAHGCHGLHSLMPSDAHPLASAAGMAVLNPTSRVFSPVLFIEPHERPQWPAA